jgi:hypothetical protein
MPKPGERLIHRFRKREGEVIAEVVSVDPITEKVVVRGGETTYSSLSAAGHAIAGHATNGWIFWGLKKQVNRTRSHA